MRGVYHILITFLFVYPIVNIMFLENFIDSWTLYASIIGIVLGSLLPDIDASDSAILHGETKIFGKFFKHLVYPIMLLVSRKIFGAENKHRGIMHSILGILIFNVILLPFSIIIAVIFLYYYNLSILTLDTRLMYFFITLTLGAILHILEDGFTVSGVYLFFPKKVKLSGNIRTFSKGEKNFASFIILSLGLTFVYSYLTHDIFITVILNIIIVASAIVVSRRLKF